jgi:hypothetical protein
MNFTKKSSSDESAAVKSVTTSLIPCVASVATTLNASPVSLNDDSDCDDCSVMSDLSDLTDIVYPADEEPYDPNALSVQQRGSGIELFGKFVCDCRWAILFAQMQSGKTETYLFVACEMLRLNIVKFAVIFSGNAETELKAQLTSVDKRNRFYRKYRNYLRRHVLTMSENDIDDALALVGAAASIQVYWGTELKKYRGPTKNTLFIWDESHFAQSIHQCPDNFLRDVGISANGDEEILRQQGNYVLSISATPFSEYSDNHHLVQGKEMVRMAPGVGYNSVAIMKETDRIIPFEDVEEGLAQACTMAHNTPKWGIVRITTKNEDLVRTTVAKHGYAVVMFDSFVDCVIDGEIKTDLSFLKQAPTRDTIVLLRGKCRMGKELDKEHILFCFETARTTATDTVLQGLLGRCCGYFYSTTIVVFLHKNIVESDELQRYIDMTNGQSITPSHGKNLVKSNKKKNKDLQTIIPVKVSRQHITVDQKNNIGLRADIIAAIKSNNAVNLNPMDDYDKIRETIDNPDTKFTVRKLDVTKYGTYATIADEINASINTSTPVKLSSGCWTTKAGEITLWRVISAPGLTAGDVYIDCRINKNAGPNARIVDVPKTTRREIFAHGLEDGTTRHTNGSFSLSLRPETASSVGDMQEDLVEIIKLSITTTLAHSRRVNSNQDFNTHTSKGICVNDNVLKSLQKDGSIYNLVYQLHNIKLKITKSSGVTPKVLKNNGYIRLASISW